MGLLGVPFQSRGGLHLNDFNVISESAGEIYVSRVKRKKYFFSYHCSCTVQFSKVSPVHEITVHFQRTI